MKLTFFAFIAAWAPVASAGTPALADVTPAQVASASSPGAPNASAAFFDRLGALCGQAFEGRITAEQPPAAASDPFHGQRLVMHVRDCGPQEIRIPFHVGSDRSRTWVITRTATGLRLKHDHRRADGSEDPITQYGGDTVGEGTSTRQTFPADVESKALFTRNDMAVSNANVWALELVPDESFVYELSRPQRLFRVSFDLAAPVPLPPPPWGAGDVK
ncbi:hypothetical protein [Dokdonella sp.]|uniref:hypothetical protein n=1 Tax=Dokdonella sp. TaxID=2291710 RepID=UPI0031C06585|nr:hypothetical protein [Dokdonella sp.]